MVDIILLIEQNVFPIYVLCVAGLLFWGWRLLRAQRKLSHTQFELEREYALNERARYFDLTAICVLILLAAIAISQVVGPYLRGSPSTQIQAGPLVFEDQFVTRVPGAVGVQAAAASGATPSPAVIAAQMVAGASGESGEGEEAAASVPTSPPIGGQRGDIFSGEVEATYTPSPTPPGTIVPDMPPPIGCTDPGAVITHPWNAQLLYEAIVVEGSANTPGFGSYKFELKGPSTGNAWAVLRTYTNPITDGVLGQFDGSAFSPGLYQFRLAVVDTGGSTIASCTINVMISEPIPTPTRIRPN